MPGLDAAVPPLQCPADTLSHFHASLPRSLLFHSWSLCVLLLVFAHVSRWFSPRRTAVESYDNGSRMAVEGGQDVPGGSRIGEVPTRLVMTFFHLSSLDSSTGKHHLHPSHTVTSCQTGCSGLLHILSFLTRLIGPQLHYCITVNRVLVYIYCKHQHHCESLHSSNANMF